MSSRALVNFSHSGFVTNNRFSKDSASSAGLSEDELDVVEPQPDPIEQAFVRGLVEGEAKAREKFDAELSALTQDYARLDRAFAEHACAQADKLSEKLRDTVMALCEATIMPAALDAELLTKRVERAASMLMRAQDERIIRLNPEDYEQVKDHISEALTIEPDPNMERGALRIETQDGGIDDGPESWRQAITEALGQC